MLPVALAVCLAANAPPPLIVIASVKGGHLVVEERQIRFAQKQMTQTVTTADGRVEKRTVTVMVPESVLVQKKWELKKGALTDPEGKKLDADAVAKRLARPAPVVVSADGKKIDPSFLKVLKGDVIVFTGPMVGAPPAPGPSPEPPAKP
jgi:hypothetical protein